MLSKQIPEESSPNRFGASARLSLNISAKFRNLGGFSTASNPGPATGGGLDRFYDDGFVRVDSTGNKGGLTWFWGYENASQLPGNDTVEMHTASGPARAVVRQEDDPQLGFELSYGRRLGQAGRMKWGLETAFGFTDLSIRNNQTLVGAATILSDAYPLGGIIPPLPPYSGSFNGPGPLIGDSPGRTLQSAPSGALIIGQRKLQANLYTLRLGPYIEVPIWKRLGAEFGGGLSLGGVNSEFSFSENVSLRNIGSVSRVGRDSRGDFLIGGYVGGQLIYEVNDRLDVFSGIQFQHLGSFKQHAAGKQAELDLGQSIFLTVGLRFAF
jgi:hypothetical protein